MSKKVYEKPSYEVEGIFERMSLDCVKCAGNSNSPEQCASPTKANPGMYQNLKNNPQGCAPLKNHGHGCE